MKLTISNHISTFSAGSFYEHVKSLHKVAVNASKSKLVPAVGLTTSKKGVVTFKFSGEKKLTTDEIALLAKEYVRDEKELTALALKRKIQITNSQTGELLNVPTKARKPRAKKSKEDDASKEGRV